ncbi:glycosyltransferase 87 family protein [Cellulomonas soli]|uniref:DUF2029 domain-containing protein n=1 Tax=Cellulomonas soli TaxID=931535 RepID=A0A512P815_9CELL|nr:glycosyltransferase 87 family protein [Cellulomonas soli]NYI57571.1 hypothetical protein [Cellulomonas soli]GEP67348.1 hypothetical protein CSO01_00630 [Cellulomonas soli]
MTAGTARTWAERYGSLAVLGLGIGLLTLWVAASYLERVPSTLMVFPPADNWCQIGTESFGVHCFGDFAIVDELFAQDAWNSGWGSVASYPALAWLPSLLIRRLGESLGGGQLPTAMFLVVAGSCLLVPAVWAAWGNLRSRLPVTVVLVGASTSAFLVTMDRANTVALTVPALLLFAVAVSRRKFGWVGVAVTVAALLKPQLALLAVVLLAHRQYRTFVLTAVSTAGFTVLGFLAFPRYFPENLFGWVRAISGYSDIQSIDVGYPVSLGASRGVLTVVDLTGLGALLGDDRAALVDALGSAAGLLNLVVIGLLAAVILLTARRVNPLWTVFLAFGVVLYSSSTVYVYYLSMLLAVAALVLRDARTSTPPTGRTWAGTLDDGPATTASRMTRVATGSLVVATVLVLAPVVVPTAVLPDGLVDAWSVGGVPSLYQLVSGPVLLAAMALVALGALRAWRSSRAGDEPQVQDGPAARADGDEVEADPSTGTVTPTQPTAEPAR